MRNILQIMDYAAPYKGNFIPSIENLETHLRQSGNRLIYMFPEGARKIDWVFQLQKEGKIVYFLDHSFFSKRIKLRNILDLLKVIKKEGVSIIHTHFIAYNYTLVLMKMIFLHDIKIIGNFMNEFHPPFNKYRRFKIFITDSTFDSIIASSSAVKESIINTGLSSGKVKIVYNALDTEHLQVYDKIDFSDNDSQKIVLMFGWTFLRKGVDIAIYAINELIDEGRDIRLVIAMAGGMEIVENEIKNQLGNVPSWITLMGPTSNVASYYNSTDIFLSASREEGFTYSVLEASYCNPMIILSEIGGHPLDIPYVGKFESESFTQLKKSIIDMLKKNNEERKVMNEAQKNYVSRTYDVNNWSKDIIKIYSNI